VTPKDQGRDPNMVRAQYLQSGWRQTFGSKEQPIWNGLWRIEWSRDRWRHV